MYVITFCFWCTCRLKRDKEFERRQVERDLSEASGAQLALGRDDEELVREREENARLASILTEQERRKQRAKETKRFVTAFACFCIPIICSIFEEK